MLQVRGLQKSYGSLHVLVDVSFSLGRGQRAALIGDNGTGKSTLLKIMAGIEGIDAGVVEFDPGVRIGYIPQDTSIVGDEPILEYLRKAVGLTEIENNLESLSHELADPENRKRYEDLLASFERLEGYSFDHRVDIMFQGFGLEGIERDRPVSLMSSGQKTKVALIAILLRNADVLLLDEPTNNLDLPALTWLEHYLGHSLMTVVMASHDRRFLDRVANKIVEIDWRAHTIQVSNGTYSDYLIMTKKRLATQLQMYQAQQKEILRLNCRVQSLKQKAQQGASWKGNDNDKFLRGFKRDRASGSARGAKTIETRIEHIQRVTKPFDRAALGFSLKSDTKLDNGEIRLEGVVSGYPVHFRTEPISLSVPYGSRVGILGLNGSGKSTLLKTITGFQAPLDGRVLVGSDVRFGHLMQEHDSLDRGLTSVESVSKRVGIPLDEGYRFLARHGIGADQANRQIRILNPGARARLLLATFAALETNVLVLDEPTNHLDLEALSALEEALSTFEGTLLAVSHDREFITNVQLDDVYLLQNGCLERIESYDEYIVAAEQRAKRLIRLL
ncbi:MAG: ABC-F family ATP-binding cassette domain-containing protein [Candidatus Uhrbacteria bacterium]